MGNVAEKLLEIDDLEESVEELRVDINVDFKTKIVKTNLINQTSLQKILEEIKEFQKSEYDFDYDHYDVSGISVEVNKCLDSRVEQVVSEYKNLGFTVESVDVEVSEVSIVNWKHVRRFVWGKLQAELGREDIEKVAVELAAYR